MKVLHKDSEILSDIKSNAFKLLATVYGGLAFESFSQKKALSTPIKSKGSEFADLGSLFFKKPISDVEPDKTPIIQLDADKRDESFLDFSFKRAKPTESLKIQSVDSVLTEKPANINPISISDKLLKLKNDNINTVQKFLKMDSNYYQDKLQRNFQDPNKDIVEKLHDFCDIAESLSRSSSSFINELKTEKVSIEETVRIQKEVGNILDKNLNQLINSGKPTVKSKMRMP